MSVNYVKGKELHVADTLLRAQLSDTIEEIDSEELELPFTQWFKTSQSLTQKVQLQCATETDATTLHHDQKWMANKCQ